jgi:transcription elongation factor GreA-like protein
VAQLLLSWGRGRVVEWGMREDKVTTNDQRMRAWKTHLEVAFQYLSHLSERGVQSLRAVNNING